MPCSTAVNLTSQSVCGCAAGLFLNASSLRCDVCPIGSYCPAVTPAGLAYPCPAGTFGNTTGMQVATCSGLCQTGYQCAAGAGREGGGCACACGCFFDAVATVVDPLMTVTPPSLVLFFSQCVSRGRVLYSSPFFRGIYAVPINKGGRFGVGAAVSSRRQLKSAELTKFR